jgi:hypothetical protein
MQLKAEVICRHFSPETIAKQSGMQFSFDVEKLPEAIQMLKNPDEMQFRVNIQSETMAQIDYARLKEERASYLNGLSTFLQTTAPLMQSDPRSMPFLLTMLKWAMAGFKGASEIEGVLDKAIDAMSQPAEQEKAKQPNPEEIRSKTQIELEKIRMQAKMQETQAKLQADMQMREADKQADIATEQARMQMEMTRLNTELQAELQKLSAKMEADVRTEMLTSQINAEQAMAVSQAEIEKELVRGRLEIEKIRMEKRADAGLKFAEKRMEHESNMVQKELDLATKKEAENGED